MMKEDLRDLVSNMSMNVHFVRRFPTMFSYENFYQSELRNSTLCRKLNGRKVFYYEFIHESGEVKLDTKFYNDYAWVPIFDFHKYFTEEQWNKYGLSLIHI